MDTDAANKPRQRYAFSAIPYPARPAGPPARHEFTPTEFYRQFSALNKPVLTISPGDTVHTTTVDAGGTDDKGVLRVLGGNPQTGPFYVRSAMPGDVLAVHLVHLRLNRDYAVSDDAVVPRGLDSGLAVRMAAGGKEVRWHLDIAKGLASVEKPGVHMARYTVPVVPMLGCIATAPATGARGAPPTQDPACSARQHGLQRDRRRRDSLPAGLGFPAPCSTWATATQPRATARSTATRRRPCSMSSSPFEVIPAAG